jgi:UDP-N-acetylmuramoyl-L-alanyl-D-glutamate--2,6-diaminopimelate ligase
MLTYGLGEGADIVAREIHASSEGVKFKISFRSRTYDISSPLIGLPNVYNIMSAAGASISMGIPWQVILDGISKTGSIRGRFEKVDVGQNFLCIIDYAHTEDAIERLILTAREFIKDSPGSMQPRIITVFGCGGDRDRGKRPRMGAVATRLSDFVILTSDNPRSEDPSDIILETESGAVKNNYIKEPDRREAIRKAVNLAREKDIILVAGKGHEEYQEIKGIRYPFNDREILEEVIKDRLKIQRRRENSGCMEVRK